MATSAAFCHVRKAGRTPGRTFFARGATWTSAGRSAGALSFWTRKLSIYCPNSTVVLGFYLSFLLLSVSTPSLCLLRWLLPLLFPPHGSLRAAPAVTACLPNGCHTRVRFLYVSFLRLLNSIYALFRCCVVRYCATLHMTSWLDKNSA